MIVRVILCFTLFVSSQVAWATFEGGSRRCTSFLQRFIRRHQNVPVSEWKKHLEKLRHFESPEFRVFDRHLIARIEVMLLELDFEQRAIFFSIMGLITFDPERTYGALYYRVFDEVGIEIDPNLFDHPMSRLVYLHELRHLSDDIKSGFPPNGMTLDTLKTETAALGEGYDYLTLVNSDPEYRSDLFPKNDVAITHATDEDARTWSRRQIDDHFGVDLHAVRRLSRERYVENAIRSYGEQINSNKNDFCPYG
jgi:hypothetical protein